MQPKPISCKNCGTRFSGNYCNHCGEKVYTDHDKSFAHIFEEAIHFITHFDSKFLKTVWLVLTRPGWVAKEYCAGKRRQYFKPISLFLVGVVIYLLLPFLPAGLNIPFRSQVSNNETMHIPYTTQIKNLKIQKTGLTEVQLEEKFDHLSPNFAKILLFVLLPVCAFGFSLMFSKRRLFFFDHFILSTEINAFILIGFFIILPILLLLINILFLTKMEAGDNLLFTFLITISFFYMMVSAFRRFYNVGFWHALAKSFLSLLVYLAALFIYRQLVFLLVMLFIK